MTDMADATSEAASMASSYNVKINELSSLIAVATSKTRESGSQTGNAIKSIFVNLTDTTNTSIQKAFDAIGVSMTEMVDGTEKLKNPIELLKELSEVFTKLDENDVRRSTILDDIGGKYHANTLSAILTGWKEYEKILQDYQDGAGSAFEESQKSATNWEGSLNRLSNTWDEFISGFVDGDKAKGVLSFLTKAIELTDFLIDHLGTLGTVLTGVMAYKGFKNEGRGKLTPLLNMLSLNYNNELMIA